MAAKLPVGGSLTVPGGRQQWPTAIDDGAGGAGGFAGPVPRDGAGGFAGGISRDEEDWVPCKYELFRETFGLEGEPSATRGVEALRSGTYAAAAFTSGRGLLETTRLLLP